MIDLKRPSTAVGTVCLLIVGSVLGSSSLDAQQTYFGEDLSGGSLTNSSAAEADFLAHLSGVGTEDFESFDTGETATLDLTFPGAGNADLEGDGVIDSNPGAGRYAISGDNWWEVDVTTGEFYIEFDDPVAAFGFYGTDIGDFGGQLYVDFLTSAGLHSEEVPHSVDGGRGGDPEGAAMFFGFIDPVNTFTRVDLRAEGGYGNETFGFDDMTIGSVEQVRPDPNVVPEPASMLLLGTGLLGLGGFAWRRRREDEESEQA